MKNEGLKILTAEIKNFKNIKQRSIDFNGRSAIILGANRKGKSSLIQAITSPINSKMVPSKPIMEGEETASLEIQIGGMLNGEKQVYNIDMYFSVKDQRGKLVVTDESGGKIPGGRSMVDSIVGNIGFDIFEFIGLGLTPNGKVSKSGVKEQIEILKSFMPKDARKKIFNLDNEKITVYDARTEINKDIKSNEAKLKDANIDPEEQEKYAKPIDDIEVKEKMTKIGESISQYDKVIDGIETKKITQKDLEKRIEELEKDLKTCKLQKDEITEQIAKGNGWLKKKGDRPSMDNLTIEFNRVSEHNDKHKKIVELQEFSKNIREFTEKSDSKTERLKNIETEKTEIFSTNPLPVKNLSFNEEEIIYEGLPFNELQHPSSTIIGVGLKIAMAMNPNLRLLIIKEGSLIDKKTMNFMLKLTEKKGFQVFIEMVDFSGEKDVTVDFIEGDIK